MGEDSSTGDDKRIFGTRITSESLDEILLPEGTRKKDVEDYFNGAVDVTHLPGMLSSGLLSMAGGDTAVADEAERTTEMATTMLATTLGSKLRLHDAMWSTEKKHALRQVVDKESLVLFVKEVDKSKKPAFERQERAFTQLMLQRRYEEDFIDEWLRNGPLCIVMRESYNNYYALLNKIRQLAYDHDHIWEGGPAHSLLQYHSDKLLRIRKFALSRRDMILRTYSYLRDAAQRDFYHESMTASIWDRLAQFQSPTINEPPPTPGGEPAPSAGRHQTCSWCKSRKLHAILGLIHAKTACPFRDIGSTTKARVAARQVVDQRNQDPQADLQNLIREALASAV